MEQTEATEAGEREQVNSRAAEKLKGKQPPRTPRAQRNKKAKKRYKIADCADCGERIISHEYLWHK